MVNVETAKQTARMHVATVQFANTTMQRHRRL